MECFGCQALEIRMKDRLQSIYIRKGYNGVGLHSVREKCLSYILCDELRYTYIRKQKKIDTHTPFIAKEDTILHSFMLLYEDKQTKKKCLMDQHFINHVPNICSISFDFFPRRCCFFLKIKHIFNAHFYNNTTISIFLAMNFIFFSSRRAYKRQVACKI